MRLQPFPIRLNRFGSRLVEEFRRMVDRNLMLDDTLNGNITQLKHGHFLSIMYNVILAGERCRSG
jgi:hypothetical protein